jgi:ATP-dependent exoDNAse (exonuclease V) alpha subunit
MRPGFGDNTSIEDQISDADIALQVNLANKLLPAEGELGKLLGSHWGWIQFTISNVTCTRTQVPLTVVWAITVHKAQGITADKVVSNISEKDYVIGLTYVAISRVKKLTDLLFEEPFDYSRFRSAKASKTETMRLADYARRLPHHIPVAVPGVGLRTLRTLRW